MTTRTLGSDQMRAIVSVVDAIMEKRGITLNQVAEEIGVTAPVICNWRAGLFGVRRDKQASLRDWILKWKHVLKKAAE